MISRKWQAHALLLGIIGFLVLTLACGGPSWEDPLQPRVTWVLESVNDNPVIEGVPIDLTIYDDSLGGFDGCNSYGIGDDYGPPLVPVVTRPDGSYMEGEFSAEDNIMTMAFCPSDAAKEQSDAYWAALTDGETFRVKDNRLEILDSEGQTTLVFVRPPPLPGNQPSLEETKWHMMGDDGPGILAFIDDEAVVGMDECLVYFGEYLTSGRLLRFNTVATSVLRQPCPRRDWPSPFYPTGSIWDGWHRSLWAAEQYSVVGQASSEKLMVGTSLGETLTFEALPTVALDTIQGEWSLTNVVDFGPDGIITNVTMIGEVDPGPAITISFQESQVSGSAGCNTYEASLRVTDEQVVIGPPSKADISCDDLEKVDDVIRQEQRYLSLLPQMTRMGTYGDRLFMSTDMGIYLLFEAE